MSWFSLIATMPGGGWPQCWSTCGASRWWCLARHGRHPGRHAPVPGEGRGDRLTALAEAGRSYALLADGTTMTIRPAGPGDYEAVRRLHEAMSPDNLYFRFFSMSRVAAEQEARRVCREAGPDHGALLGLLGDELVGVASYELIPGLGRRRSPWRLPTACTGAASPRCCLSTWSRWPAPAASRPSPLRRCRRTAPCCGCSPTRGWLCGASPAAAWLSCPCRSRKARPSVRPAPIWTRWPAGRTG